MTQEEMKKIDKKINVIQEPFGKGFPSLQRVFLETAMKKDSTEEIILHEYLVWKKSKKT
nr:hypothetical protein [uncultured Caproiciproducens sp.]